MLSPPGPTWFHDALATPHDQGEVDVAGCPINYLQWGRPEDAGLVLVHGGAAHARWWSFIAPFLATDYHVVALDLSGHGDSGRRENYAQELWAEELLAVAGDVGMEAAPIVIGHSLGGLVTATAAALHGDRLSGAIIIDSGIRRPDPESQASRAGRHFGNQRVYATRADALDRFKLIPPQPCDNDWALEHIAGTSLRQNGEGGWVWKFDPKLFARTSERTMPEYLAEAGCRIALVRGELSQVNPPDVAAYMYDLMDRRSPVVTIPEARHHVMVDQPLALVAALRALLADWDHSTPTRNS